jgi:predicted GNAT family N-acyltransferase
MKFQQIAYGSPAYQEELLLRDAVLRKPLGLALKDEDLSQEASQWHFGLFDGDLLIASVIAAPKSEELIQLRQMAVSSQFQGQGCGRKLAEMLEKTLLGKGFQKIILHARIQVFEFYIRLGYMPVGELFEEVGIPHQCMQKTISQSRF